MEMNSANQTAKIAQMLSIVLNVTFAKGAALESAMLSLAGQHYRPSELILLVPEMQKTQMEQWQADFSARWKAVLSNLQFVCVEQGLEEGQRYALGIEQATGQYITLLDDWHRIYPYTYTSSVQYLQEHPQDAWAFTNIGVALENEHHQVVQRIDPDPSRSYVGVDYLEVDEICLPGVVIDRERMAGRCNLQELFGKASSASVIALLALQSKPGHVPILGGELRQSKEDFEKGANEIRKIGDHAILPWWLIEFQSRQLQAKEGAAIKSSIKSETTLHQQLEEMQSSYYRQLYVVYRQSTSGKITRVILRNLPWASEIHAKISQYPTSEIEAIDKIIALQSLTLWDLTAPIRWLGKIRQTIKG
jgi:hypothetical protein